jgi:hypothetical protein
MRNRQHTQLGRWWLREARARVQTAMGAALLRSSGKPEKYGAEAKADQTVDAPTAGKQERISGLIRRNQELLARAEAARSR